MIIELMDKGKNLLDLVDDYCQWNMKDLKRLSLECKDVKDEKGHCNCNVISEGCGQVYHFVRLLKETSSEYWSQVLTRSKNMQHRRELR